MKSSTSLFIPSYKSVIAIALANLLIFGAIGGAIFYTQHLQNLTTHDGPNPISHAKFIEDNGNTYWLGMNYDTKYIEKEDDPFNSISIRTFYIQVKTGDRISSIPFFQLKEPDQLHNHSSISLSLQMKLDDYLLVIFEDRAVVSGNGTNGDDLYWGRYLGVIKLNDDLSALDRFHLFNVNNSEFRLNQILPYGSDLVLHLIPSYEWIFDYLDSPEQKDAIAISSDLKSRLFDAIATAPDLGFYQYGERPHGQLLNFTEDEAPAIDYLSVLEEEYGSDRGLYKIDLMKESDIKLIDSQGTIHILGRPSEHLERQDFRVEGQQNYSVFFNQPDYLAYHPSTNTSQYWDLTTIYLLEKQTKLIEVSDGLIAVKAVHQDHQELFSNPKLNPTSDEFDREYYDDWWRINKVQYFVFEPFNPDVSNFIQFDQDLSQTADSTVIYPRPANIGVIDFEILSPTSMTVQKHQTGWTMFIALKLFVTTKGLSTNLNDLTEGGHYWSSKGNSLVVFRIEASENNTLTNVGYQKVTGPENELQPGYTDKDWSRPIPGIHLSVIYHSFIDQVDDEETLTIVYSGYMQKYGIRRPWGVVFEPITVSEVVQ